MKNKKQTQVAVEDSEQDETSSQQDSETNEKTNGKKNGSSSVHLTKDDQEKGILKNFDISKKTLKKLKARNIEYLFPVQAESYTSIHEQKDCIIQSSTGSGKTLAFALPIVELLQSDKSVELVAGRAPRVLVVVPTKEITKQISDDIQSIVNDLSIVTIFSAKKKSDNQETAIANGCDILIATPDRLKEFIDEEKVDLSEIKHVVLDEVETDDDLKKILKHSIKSDEETKAQLIIVSQTIPDSVRKLTKKYLTKDFVTIDLAKTTKEETIADDDDEEDVTEAAETTDDSNRSLFTKQENYTTYKLSVNDELKGVGLVFTMLRKCFGDDFDAKGTCSQIGFTKDFKSAVFDLPNELNEQLQNNWKDSPRIQMGPIEKLPVLDEESMFDSRNEVRGGSRPARGGGGGRGGGAGGRSNACYNCQKEGHMSWECPEASQRNGGNRSGGGGGGGGNACFNCGKDGHKSFECSEPKKAGGRPGGGGGGSNSCFNCGKDGHKSFECSEPKKAGGRPGGGGGGGSNACFNCGKDGHKSFECSEPKKAGGGGGGGGSNACFNCGQEGHRSFECSEPKKGRPSFGGGDRGGRGGGRGGSRGGSRDFGPPKRSFNDNYGNGSSAGEATNKKIKFDDDE